MSREFFRMCKLHHVHVYACGTCDQCDELAQELLPVADGPMHHACVHCKREFIEQTHALEHLEKGCPVRLSLQLSKTQAALSRVSNELELISSQYIDQSRELETVKAQLAKRTHT